MFSVTNFTFELMKSVSLKLIAVIVAGIVAVALLIRFGLFLLDKCYNE